MRDQRENKSDGNQPLNENGKDQKDFGQRKKNLRNKQSNFKDLLDQGNEHISQDNIHLMGPNSLEAQIQKSLDPNKGQIQQIQNKKKYQNLLLELINKMKKIYRSQSDSELQEFIKNLCEYLIFKYRKQIKQKQQLEYQKQLKQKKWLKQRQQIENSQESEAVQSEEDSFKKWQKQWDLKKFDQYLLTEQNLFEICFNLKNLTPFVKFFITLIFKFRQNKELMKETIMKLKTTGLGQKQFKKIDFSFYLKEQEIEKAMAFQKHMPNLLRQLIKIMGSKTTSFDDFDKFFNNQKFKIFNDQQSTRSELTKNLADTIFSAIMERILNILQDKMKDEIKKRMKKNRTKVTTPLQQIYKVILKASNQQNQSQYSINQRLKDQKQFFPLLIYYFQNKYEYKTSPQGKIKRLPKKVCSKELLIQFLSNKIQEKVGLEKIKIDQEFWRQILREQKLYQIIREKNLTSCYKLYYYCFIPRIKALRTDPEQKVSTFFWKINRQKYCDDQLEKYYQERDKEVSFDTAYELILKWKESIERENLKKQQQEMLNQTGNPTNEMNEENDGPVNAGENEERQDVQENPCNQSYIARDNNDHDEDCENHENGERANLARCDNTQQLNAQIPN